MLTPSCVTEFPSPYQSSVLPHPPVQFKEGRSGSGSISSYLTPTSLTQFPTSKNCQGQETFPATRRPVVLVNLPPSLEEGLLFFMIGGYHHYREEFEGAGLGTIN